MASDNFKIKKGLNIDPGSASGTEKGDLHVDTSTGKLKHHNGTTESPVVTESHSSTLTNKSIDADTNTITNIENADIKAAAAIALNKLAATTASRALASDGSGFVEASSVTATELGRLSGISSSAVGTTDTQTLTNKYLQGGTASTTNRIKLPSDTTGNLTTLDASLTAGDIVYDSTVGAIKYRNGSSLQTLASGSLSTAAVGSSPNSAGLSVSALQITMQPADSTNPGVVTTASQSFAGVKTFNSGLIVDDAAGQDTLNYYDTGTHSDTLLNMNASAPSIDLEWVRIGNLVVITLTALVNTASKNNTSDPTINTGLPVAIRPSSGTRYGTWWIMNNGAEVVGRVLLNSGAGMTFQRDPGGTAWTSGAQARIYPGFITYNL